VLVLVQVQIVLVVQAVKVTLVVLVVTPLVHSLLLVAVADILALDQTIMLKPLITEVMVAMAH
jgi:hypothetical protein